MPDGRDEDSVANAEYEDGLMDGYGKGRGLFDCGAGITRNMVRANVSPADVTAVFLTHMHHDHICDFPLFVITGWMWDRPDSPVVIGPRGTRAMTDHILAAWREEAARAAGLPGRLTEGSVVASDAFFPFADGLLQAAEAGATAVIQPGGSLKDDEVIAAADGAGLAMVFTGRRHFRH